MKIAIVIIGLVSVIAVSAKLLYKPEKLFVCFDGKNISQGLKQPIDGSDCFEDLR